MAINQCLEFLNLYPAIERKEFSDTALAAKEIKENNMTGVAAIASKLAAEIYDLNIVAENIETVDSNYTRFFTVQKNKAEVAKEADKASIYIKLQHERGSLLEVLKVVDEYKINISKLQSFPVLGSLHEYYFYLDFEFDHFDLFDQCIVSLKNICLDCEVMGVYKKAAVPSLHKLKLVAG